MRTGGTAAHRLRARRDARAWMLPVATVAIVAGWLALVFAVGAAPTAPLPVPTAAKVVTKAAGDATVYRFFNRVSGVHFYTADAAERAAVITRWPQLADEGAVYRALLSAAPGATPIWRFYNTATGAHFYTADAAERLRVLQTLPQFVDEGIVFYAYPGDAFDRLPVHRFYNNATRTHFFTASEAERDFV